MLTLVETKTVNNVLVDGYLDGKTPYFTREQIGLALEYDHPKKSVAVIHSRHKERLDKYSRGYQIDTPSGKQEAVVYNIKGVFEICRWSKQPKADMVMDALYDMAEEVLTKGYFSLMSDEALAQLLDEKVNRAVNGKKRIRESREQQTVLLDLERNHISHEDYIMRLRCIWGEDSYGFHKAFDEYMSWYNTVGRRVAVQ